MNLILGRNTCTCVSYFWNGNSQLSIICWSQAAELKDLNVGANFHRVHPVWERQGESSRVVFLPFSLTNLRCFRNWRFKDPTTKRHTNYLMDINWAIWFRWCLDVVFYRRAATFWGQPFHHPANQGGLETTRTEDRTTSRWSCSSTCYVVKRENPSVFPPQNLVWKESNFCKD